MKKIVLVLAFLIIAGLPPYILIAAEQSFTVYFFVSEGCPHCADEKEFLNQIQDDYPGMELMIYDVTSGKKEYELFQKFCSAYDVTPITPVIFIGNQYVSGFVDADTTGPQIKEKLDYCTTHTCVDPIRNIQGLEPLTKKEAVSMSKKDPIVQSLLEQYPNAHYETRIEDTTYTVTWIAKDKTVHVTVGPAGIISSTEEETKCISIPFIGEINPSTVNLPVLTIIIGGLDGFNPCAIWVLCFLLTLLLYVKSRKRMIIVGSIFVLTSGIVYFIFMTAWLNFFLFIGYVDIMRIIIGIVAIIAGALNAKDFFFFKKGVSLTIPESKKPALIKRMRKIMKKEGLLALIVSTIGLAFFANLVELLCSAGFPAIYTRILTLNALPPVQYYLYLGLYNCVYVVPLLVIVSVFVITMGRRKVTETQGRILKLVSGVFMLILGILLILRPDILVFG